jgi:hypothetical protein
MKRRSLVSLLALLATPALLGAPVRAQDNEENGIAPRGARLKSFDYVIKTMGRGAGVTILAESSYFDKQAPMPKEATTVENLEEQLAILAKALPSGTIFTKVMLPAPPNGRVYRGDDLAEFIAAQTKLFNRMSLARTNTNTAEPSVVEVLGQKLTETKAAPVVSTLGLKPYYLISNPKARLSTAGVEFSALSPEDQAKWAADQANNFKNNPQAMQQFLQQGMMVMRNVMGSMSPQERQSFMQNMGQMMRGFGGPPGPPGAGGGQ